MRYQGRSVETEVAIEEGWVAAGGRAARVPS